MSKQRINQANELVTLFVAKYVKRFGKNPIVNRIKQKYVFYDILEDLSVKQIKELIDFYIRTDADPSITKLGFEYDELLMRMERDREDEGTRRQLRIETERRVSDFRERYSKDK